MRSRSIAGARNAMQCRASHPTDLLQAFRPFLLLTNPHAQTIIAATLTFAREPPSSTRLVKLPDGDMLALEVSTPQGWQPYDPTVVVVHGLCGCHRVVTVLWTRNSWPGLALSRHPYGAPGSLSW
jgi:predicted alpha/beta-fold hydrolase